MWMQNENINDIKLESAKTTHTQNKYLIRIYLIAPVASVSVESFLSAVIA